MILLVEKLSTALWRRIAPTSEKIDPWLNTQILCATMDRSSMDSVYWIGDQ